MQLIGSFYIWDKGNKRAVDAWRKKVSPVKFIHHLNNVPAYDVPGFLDEEEVDTIGAWSFVSFTNIPHSSFDLICREWKF